MKFTSILRWSSLLATLLLGVLVLCTLANYYASIHRPGQGGWNLDRLREIGFSLAPLFVLFVALLLSRPSRLPRGLHYLAGALLVISAPFALLLSGVYGALVVAALVLHFFYLRGVSYASAVPNHTFQRTPTA